MNALHAKIKRTEPWPAGLLYYSAFKIFTYPLTKQDADLIFQEYWYRLGEVDTSKVYVSEFC